MRDHEVPEEDRREQEQPPAPGSPSEAEDPPPDVPEEDAQEQERPGPGDAKPEPPDEEVPEEDALEQGRREDPGAERDA